MGRIPFAISVGETCEKRPRYLSELSGFLLESTIERFPGQPAGSVVDFRSADFVGAKIGALSNEIVVDCGDYSLGIDEATFRLELKIQIHDVVDCIIFGYVGRTQVLENVVNASIPLDEIVVRPVQTLL